MSNHDVARLLTLRVKRAIKGKLTDDQLAKLIADEFLKLTIQLPKVA